MAEERLYSKYLNNLIGSIDAKNAKLKFAEYTEVNFITACGIAGFMYREDNGTLRKMEFKDVEPVIKAFTEDLMKDSSNTLSFYRNTNRRGDENYYWAWPSNASAEKELADMISLSTATDEEIEEKMQNNPNCAAFSGKDRKQIYEGLRNGARKYIQLHKEGYKGPHPEIVNLISRLYMHGNRLQYNFDENGNNINVEESPEDICVVPKMNRELFWSYIETMAAVLVWNNNRKIYRVSDTLAEDFINQKDLAVPADALKYMPHKSFAIDLSRTPEFNGYFDCVFVNVLEDKGNYKIIFKVFDAEGTPANTGFEIAFVFYKDEDFTITDESLKEFYTKGTLELFNKHKEHAKKCAGEYILLHDNDNYNGPQLLSLKLVEDNIAKRLKNAPFYISAYYNYQPVPPRKYRKLERFLLSTIFYLCCSNKTVKKTNVPFAEGEGNSPAYTGTKSRVEIEELGENIDESALLVFNELDLNDDGERVTMVSGKGTGKGSPHKPHLVRGHFHHYRCGKGRKDVIYKYTKPYYTGVRKNIVSITTIK